MQLMTAHHQSRQYLEDGQSGRPLFLWADGDANLQLTRTPPRGYVEYRDPVPSLTVTPLRCRMGQRRIYQQPYALDATRRMAPTG